MRYEHQTYENLSKAAIGFNKWLIREEEESDKNFEYYAKRVCLSVIGVITEDDRETEMAKQHYREGQQINKISVEFCQSVLPYATKPDEDDDPT